MAANKVHWWDAPKGYKALPCKDSTYHILCSGCHFWESHEKCPTLVCMAGYRKDKQDVIFVKRDNNNKK